MENPNMKINQERINELKSFAIKATDTNTHWTNIKHEASLLNPSLNELMELEKQLKAQQQEDEKNRESLLLASTQIKAELGEAFLISDYVLAGKKIAELRAQQEIVTMRLEALNNQPSYNVQPLWQSMKAKAAMKALAEKEAVFIKKFEELKRLMMEINDLTYIADISFMGTSTFGYVSNNLPKSTARKAVDLKPYY